MSTNVVYIGTFTGDVHTSHCCILHGCKYGDTDCTVTNATHKQEYLCESCVDDYIFQNKLYNDKETWNKISTRFVSKQRHDKLKTLLNE